MPDVGTSSVPECYDEWSIQRHWSLGCDSTQEVMVKFEFPILEWWWGMMNVRKPWILINRCSKFWGLISRSEIDVEDDHACNNGPSENRSNSSENDPIGENEDSLVVKTPVLVNLIDIDQIDDEKCEWTIRHFNEWKVESRTLIREGKRGLVKKRLGPGIQTKVHYYPAGEWEKRFKLHRAVSSLRANGNTSYWNG